METDPMDLLSFRNIDCPYCGESIEIQIDRSVPEQQYIEDCQVCCRPIVISISVISDEEVAVTVKSENE